MKSQFYNTIEDLRWILTTHLKDFPRLCFNSFIVYGNEDCPEKVELFTKLNPNYNSKPCATFVINEDGKLKRVVDDKIQ